MNYLLLGQDWLEKFGFNLQIPSLGITLPAYSETVVRIPARETGNRLVESQELQENMYCASSVVECVNNFFVDKFKSYRANIKTLSTNPRTT